MGTTIEGGRLFPYRLAYSQKTDIGRAREKNEDFAACEVKNSRLVYFILADGLGGLARGEIASRTAVTELQAFVKASEEFKGAEWLKEAFQDINAGIFGVNCRKPVPEWMATTLTSSVFHSENLTVVHVGDCRVYQIRGGKISCLTRDHSIDRHTLTRAIGTEARVEADIYELPLLPHDTYVQCSDGLYSVVHEEDILSAVTRFPPPESCECLVHLANQNDGRDNITLQVIHLE